MRIKKRLEEWLGRLLLWAAGRRLYVDADGRDNSVTLSPRLVRRLHIEGLEEARMFVFKIPRRGSYGFALNAAQVGKDAQTGELRYNTRYKCVGFVSLCPTVSRILYDYGMEAGRCYRLGVKRRRAGEVEYYEIMRPRG